MCANISYEALVDGKNLRQLVGYYFGMRCVWLFLAFLELSLGADHVCDSICSTIGKCAACKNCQNERNGDCGWCWEPDPSGFRCLDPKPFGERPLSARDCFFCWNAAISPPVVVVSGLTSSTLMATWNVTENPYLVPCVDNSKPTEVWPSTVPSSTTLPPPFAT